MTVICLNDVGKSKLQELAAKGVLTGLLVEELDPYDVHGAAKNGGGYKVYPYLVSSRSDKSLYHEVEIFKHNGAWQAWCDAGAPDELACKANRVGMICCSHIAVALAELKKKVLAEAKTKWEQPPTALTDKLARAYAHLPIKDIEAHLKKDEDDIFGW